MGTDGYHPLYEIYACKSTIIFFIITSFFIFFFQKKQKKPAALDFLNKNAYLCKKI